MSEGPTSSSIFQQKLEERRKKQAEELAQASSRPHTTEKFDADLIPEQPFERSEEDELLDKVITSIGVADAYQRWCNKSPVVIKGNQTEGIKVSCPIPGHPDKDPSAWLNTEKNTWFCGGCQIGGDVYDIAAYHYGFPVPGYKDGATFHDLRREMAKSYGYSFVKPPGADKPLIVAPEPEPISKPDSEPQGEVEGATVTELFEDDDEEIQFDFPSIDWRGIVPDDTFLRRYLEQTTVDDVPEEYHFWNGLLALGFALGRDTTLFDRIPVYGNLFLCILGHSGGGKSQSRYHLDQLLTKALPHKWDDPNSIGVRRVQAPASAEVLIHNFMKPVMDPTNPKITAYFAPVRGMVDFNEMSSLIGRTSRQGNVLKPTLMQFYDMESAVATSSMTTGTKEAHDPFCSVLTTTQPRVLSSLLKKNDTDSGFLNRWVFVAGPPKQRFAIGGVMVDIDPCVDPLLKIVGWTGASKQVQWSDEAAKTFTDFFHAQIEPLKRADDSGLLTRIDLVIKKLILLFAANSRHKVADVDDVRSAIKLYPYLISAYSIPAAEVGNTLQGEVREEILRHAEKFKDKQGITLRELNQRLKRKKYPLDLVVKTLKYMCDIGELELITQNRGPGRPTTRYRNVG